MSAIQKILPFEGRCHAQRDGGVQAFDAMHFADTLRYPSVARAARHLPLQGRIAA